MAERADRVEPGPTAGEGAAPPAVELRGINKRFGAVQANRDIDLAVDRGSVTGIIGENGAGKSTLVSILYGFYTADSGEVRIDGEPVRMHGSSDAIDHGIGMVHQHFMLVPTMTVLENVMLGREGGPLLAAGNKRHGSGWPSSAPRTGSTSIRMRWSGSSRSAFSSGSRS